MRLPLVPVAALLVAACADKSEGNPATENGGTGAGGGKGGSSGAAAMSSGHGGSSGAGTGGAAGSGATGGVSAAGGASGSAGAMPAGATSAAAGSGGDSGASGGVSGAGGRGGAGGQAASGGEAAGKGGSAGAVAGAAGSAGSAATCTSSSLMKGNSNRTVDVGGTSRSFILHVPSGYTGTSAVPLVLDFHGLGGSGMQQQSSSGFQAVSDKEGFLIAFPDGIDNAWNIGPCCTNSRDVDDLGFAKAMVTTLAAEGCVDLHRVYATGFSMGGGMSHYLACQAADVFAAVAPASFDLLVPEEEPCAPSRPISVLAFRGTADTVVPFAGGKGSSGRITFMGAEASFERWAGLDGCVEPTNEDGDCTYYTQCDGGAEVGLCVKQGGSHAPGDANVGWAFLSRFTLP